MTNAVLKGKQDAANVASAKPMRRPILCANSVHNGNGKCARAILPLVLTLAAWTLLAGRTAISDKSYFIDTRCPVVAMSVAGELDTNPSGLAILIL